MKKHIILARSQDSTSHEDTLNLLNRRQGWPIENFMKQLMQKMERSF
jgi:hypothetical protein